MITPSGQGLLVAILPLLGAASSNLLVNRSWTQALTLSPQVAVAVAVVDADADAAESAHPKARTGFVDDGRVLFSTVHQAKRNMLVHHAMAPAFKQTGCAALHFTSLHSTHSAPHHTTHFHSTPFHPSQCKSPHGTWTPEDK
jgi:hypothetical protein